MNKINQALIIQLKFCLFSIISCKSIPYLILLTIKICRKFPMNSGTVNISDII